MPRNPLSAALRLLPTLLWLGVSALALWKLVELLANFAGTWLGMLVPLALLALAAFGVRKAYEEYRDARSALSADIPIGVPWRRKRATPPTRYPLAEPLRTKAQERLEALQTAGVLRAGEAPLDEFIDCAENEDEYVDLNTYDVVGILHILESRRTRPFANLAFFADQVEVSEDDVSAMVREFARLAGQAEQLGTIRVSGINGGQIQPAPRGEFPPDNAVVEFELAARPCYVPFVMYYKNVPGRLMEGLAKLFVRADDPRRFFAVYFDSAYGVCYLPAAAAGALNRALPEQPLEAIE